MNRQFDTQARLARDIGVSQAALSIWKKNGAPVCDGLQAVIDWRKDSGKNSCRWGQWSCPRCGVEKLHSERARDGSGKLLKHCGCLLPKVPAPAKVVDLKRSALRKAEAWRRANPQADAHVRLYCNLFSKSKRSIWCCPFCDREIRKMDRPKDASGRSKKHCGCRVERIADRSLPVAVRYKPAQIARRRRKCEELGNEYIRKLLIGKWTPGKRTVDFPQPLIDLKREVVRIERFIRKEKETAK